MIPGGLTPADRPLTEQDRLAGTLRDGQARRNSAKSTWITLIVIVVVVGAMIVLLSLMPDATVTPTSDVTLPPGPAG